METRTLRFADSSVRIECRGADAVALVDFLFPDVFPNIGGEPAPPPHVSFRVSCESDRWDLSRKGTSLYAGRSPGVLAERLLGEAIHDLVDRSRSGLILHAAAVCSHGGGMVLPGPTGIGKTTLTVRLLGMGFGYLTDELVHLPGRSDELRPFSRPLVVKQYARALLEPHVDLARHAARGLTGDDTILIPPASLEVAERTHPSRLQLLVFPRPQADARFTLKRLSKAQAAMALMGCVINARNLSEHGLREVSRVARQIPAYRMTYHDPGAVELGELVSLWEESLAVVDHDDHQNDRVGRP